MFGGNNHNCIHEDIKSRRNMGNAWYHAVQNILPSCLLHKIKNKRYRTIILPTVLF
jgi:hypothetical protein